MTPDDIADKFGLEQLQVLTEETSLMRNERISDLVEAQAIGYTIARSDKARNAWHRAKAKIGRPASVRATLDERLAADHALERLAAAYPPRRPRLDAADNAAGNSDTPTISKDD